MLKVKKREEVEVRPSSKMTTSTVSGMVPGAEPGVRPTNIDEVVVDGKLYRKEAYQENGSTQFRLVEVE